MAYEVSVFISHSWSYSDHYDCLADWIFGGNWSANNIPIKFWDVSVPKNNPIHYAPSDAALKAAIFDRIAMAHVVVIPTGMYASYSKWIGKEIDGAHQMGRPILAVNPWSQERKSSVVVDASDEHVGWNKLSVAKAIWRLSPYG